jgi:hypothetical protein
MANIKISTEHAASVLLRDLLDFTGALEPTYLGTAENCNIGMRMVAIRRGLSECLHRTFHNL